MSEPDRCGWCGRVELAELAGRHRCVSTDRETLGDLAFWNADETHQRAVEIAAAAHATGSAHHAREAQRAQAWASWLMLASQHAREKRG